MVCMIPPPVLRKAQIKRHYYDCIFATLANANEWAEIEGFAKKKEAWLRRYLELAYGIPTDDTFRIVIGNIDAGHFFRITVQLLTNTVDRILSISGDSVK